MIHIPCVQGSEQWLRLRMGRPTASEFDKIITAAKKETKDGVIKGWQPTESETRRKYLVFLLTELILDMPLSGVKWDQRGPSEGLTTAAMDHGHDWEPKARKAYALLNGVDVEDVGFCTDETGTVGASPDGFVDEDGSLEIKCPEKPEIHCGYMLSPATLIEKYWVQTQGQLFVTERKWTDLISYFGGMPMVCERVVPHPEFQSRLREALRLFTNDLKLYVDLAKDKGWIKPVAEPVARDHSRDFLSDADVEERISRLKAQGVL